MTMPTLAPTRRRFTVQEFRIMAEAGVFGKDERLELIDGEIIEMASIGLRHMGCVNRSNQCEAHTQYQETGEGCQ